MALIRDHGKIVFVCDECGEGFETDETDFYNALDAFRTDAEPEGWTSSNTGSGESPWVNYCPECSKIQ